VQLGLRYKPLCGLAGFWRIGGNRQSADDLNRTVVNIASVLSSRGPDDSGYWVNAACGIALGHNRLAVLDLSPAGHQPMRSHNGRFTISFNGEIYNHLLLRAELGESGDRLEWRSHSDTETLLASIEHWGVEGALKRCVGMFAFALWDGVSQTLTLARDRLGEKPLYYGWPVNGDKSAFVFASELKAIRAYPGFNVPVSRLALSQYLRFSYVPAPLSIYEGVFKLEPGCMLTIKGVPPRVVPSASIAIGVRYETLEIRRWWLLEDCVANSRTPFESEAIAIDELESALTRAVAGQSLADVPLGAFLSGGVDSSTIVALMQSQSSKSVKTFTIGFDEAGFDESPHARMVANHLGTDHHEMRVSSRMAQDVIPSLPWMYDEPFADSSQIPTHLVCKAAKQHVTVVLSGDGGDEMFGGYNRYVRAPGIWERFAWLPFPLRVIMGQVILHSPIAAWDRAGVLAGVSSLGEKVQKLSSCLASSRNLDEVYWDLVSIWDPILVMKGINQACPSPWESNQALPTGLNPVERMMFRDTVTYLPDDILCKVDRAAMACSLETRVPFLDHRVVELAWRLPLNMKIRGNTGKWALRQVLYKYVPKELIERPKAGFAIPIGQWLRGPLRDWAESLLGETRLRQEGYFHPDPIRKAWTEHLAGRRDHTPKIWIILMFQAWLEDQSNLSSSKVNA
jgi:asparagine synthase (glutamine-hydrolysing)